VKFYRKNIDFEQLKKEEKVALVLILLKQLQPYLSDINLTVTKEMERVKKFLDKVNVQQQNTSGPFNVNDYLSSKERLPCLLSCYPIAITNQKLDDNLRRLSPYQKKTIRRTISPMIGPIYFHK